MFSYLIDLIKRNFLIIIFFVFLGFIVTSVWYNNSQGSNYAKDLLVFAKGSVEYVDDTLDKISTDSENYKSVDEDFDKMLTQLRTFSAKLKVYASTIPNKNTDSDSINLETNLRKFFNYIRNDLIDKYVDKYVETKSLQNDYQVYGQLKNFTGGGKISDIKKALDSGTKILDSELKYVSLVADSKSNSSLKSTISADKDNISKLNTLLANKNNDEVLSSSEVLDAQDIYKNGYPLEFPEFPKIDIGDLKTSTFNNNVSSLQNSLNAVAGRFSLG